MMRALTERGQRLAAAAKARTIDRLAADLRADVPGIKVDAGSDRIVVRGRGLLQRWLSDPALRFSATRGG
jgi:hypothetical protein